MFDKPTVWKEILTGGTGSGFRVRGSGFGVRGSGFRVQGSGLAPGRAVP